MPKPFKYQRQIDELIKQGCKLPPLFSPDNWEACRFAFSASCRSNHIPQYVSNPRRMLNDITGEKATTSLLALSCFKDEIKAVKFYKALCLSMRNAALTIGDSLAKGFLTKQDGLVTHPSANSHFDLYEYPECDLNQTFHITHQL